MLKVRKCPRCGDIPAHIRKTEAGLFYVKCDKCGFRGPEEKDPMRAIARWPKGKD